MIKLAIITTHPIQYYAPFFRLLHERGKVSVRVFYTWGSAGVSKTDPGFNRTIDWDVPLLEGYPFEFVENTAKEPGSHHAKGIINPGLIPRLKEWGTDAVLVYGWLYTSHLSVLRYFKNKVPVFFRGDSTLLDEKPGLKNILRMIWLRSVYRNVDYALYPGRNSKKYFQKYGLTEKQLIYAPHAIDNRRFAEPQEGAALALRTSLGISEQDTVVLFAGKFERKKAPLLLLEAFVEMARPFCHLIFAGNGPLENQLREQAGDHQQIHFIPFQNQSYMPVIYQSCDLFCLPSEGPGETWGLAVNEAMTCRKAILVSDKVGCAPDLVRPEKNGLIFKAGDKKSLTQALTTLTRSKAKLSLFGDTSAAIIAAWNFEKSAAAIENKLI